MLRGLTVAIDSHSSLQAEEITREIIKSPVLYMQHIIKDNESFYFPVIFLAQKN